MHGRGHMRGNMKCNSTPPVEFETPTYQSPNLQTGTAPIQRDEVQESFSDTLSLYHQYYLSKEKDGHVNPTYLSSVQKLVKLKDRYKAVEVIYWFHRISNHQFDKTFIHAIRILDRFLSLVMVSTNREFYKLTVTCIYLASKYEECYLSYGIDGILQKLNKTLRLEFFHYKAKDFFEAEEKILKVLEYRLSVPTLDEFVSLMSENASPELRKIIRYLTLYSCNEYSILRIDLSVLSCAIVYLAEAILNDWSWDYFDQNNVSEIVWKKNPTEVKKCARILWSLVSKCRFTTLRFTMSHVKCSTKQNKEMSVTELVDLWGKKILFLENSRKQNNDNEVLAPNNNNSPLMFVNYGVGGMIINNYTHPTNNSNYNNNYNNTNNRINTSSMMFNNKFSHRK